MMTKKELIEMVELHSDFIKIDEDKEKFIHLIEIAYTLGCMQGKLDLRDRLMKL